MKTPSVIGSLLMLAIIGGCDRREALENQPVPESGTTTPAAAGASEPPAVAEAPAPDSATDDSLALGLLAAVNEHEIAAARQAESKQVSAPVLAYAQMMIKQHRENLAQTKALGTLASTPEVQATKDQGKSDLEALGQKNGKDYEAAYIDAMVDGHAEALGLIDGRLLSLASVGPVKDHLLATRDHIVTHLEEAKQLQAKEK